MNERRAPYVKNSCTNCSKRHLKCCDVKPCTNCIDKGIEDTCISSTVCNIRRDDKVRFIIPDTPIKNIEELCAQTLTSLGANLSEDWIEKAYKKYILQENPVVNYPTRASLALQARNKEWRKSAFNRYCVDSDICREKLQLELDMKIMVADSFKEQDCIESDICKEKEIIYETFSCPQVNIIYF